MIEKILSLFSHRAYAQIVNPFFGPNVADSPELNQIIPNVITGLLIAGALAASGYLIVGALKWISASGDKNNLAIAKQQIVQALIGLFILLSVWAILSVVGTLFGVSLINLSIPGSSPENMAVTCEAGSPICNGAPCCNPTTGARADCLISDTGVERCRY